jgi:hypothetical protein
MSIKIFCILGRSHGPMDPNIRLWAINIKTPELKEAHSNVYMCN